MNAANGAAKQRDDNPRVGNVAAELRQISRAVDRLEKDLPFAKDLIDMIRQRVARATEAWRAAEAQNRETHRQVRSKLAAKFKGTIEKHIYTGDDEEMKVFFRKVWRD